MKNALWIGNGRLVLPHGVREGSLLVEDGKISALCQPAPEGVIRVDAAGGYVDGDTLTTLRAAQIDPVDSLNQNDSYTALKTAKGLLFTGPTGTNVNDVAVVLIR